MKKINFLMLCLILMGSCTTITKTSKEAAPVVELGKADFSLSDQVSGSATEVRILGVDWSRLFNRKTARLVSAPMLGGRGPSGRVEGYAIHDLLAGNPGHDVVFYPTYTRHRLCVLYLYIKTEVTVKARLGSLNK